MTERFISQPDDAGRAGAPVEGVALIHGLGRTRLVMELLAIRLRRAGFEAVCIDYRSRRVSLAKATETVARRVARLARNWDVVHLVGHSLGGVIASAIARGRPDLPVGRVVMIGAPMRGSALAALGARLAPVRAIMGPVLAELGTSGGPVPPSERIGAIAGIAGDPVIGREFGLVGPHDGKVTLRSAWAGAGHRVAVHVGHAMLPFSIRVAELTEAFLKHGRFPADTERAARHE
jgi:pimeloyl-ACP methyl ester carboxylesterase